MDEALEAHTNIEKHVVSQVFSMTGDLHEQLLALRTTMKNELTAMQGNFAQVVTESIAQLAHPVSDVQYPEITAETLPQDVVRILVERLSAVELRMNAQQAVNATLKHAVKADYQVQDHFDAITVQMSLLERQINAQKKTISKLESTVEAMRQSQEKLFIELEERVQAALNGEASLGEGTNETSDKGDSQKQKFVMSRRRLGSARDDYGGGSYGGGAPNRSQETNDPFTGGGSFANHPFGAMAARAAYMAGVEDPFRPSPFTAESVASSSNTDAHEKLKEELKHLSEDLGDRLYALETQLAGPLAVRLEMMDKSSSGLTGGVQELRETVKQLKTEIDILQDLDRDIIRMESMRKNNVGEDIENAKAMWRRVLADINVGLDNLHVNASEGTKSDQLVPGLSAFRIQLMSSLPAFDSLGTPEATLDALYPRLDALTSEATRLLELDHEARLPESLGITFDDIVCSDRSYSLADHLASVCDLSSRILDQRVQKVHLKRRIDKLEKLAASKADVVDLGELERDLRVLIAAKADVRDVEGILGKKASVAELQQFRELVFNQIEDLRLVGFNGAAGTNRKHGDAAGSDDESKQAEKEELVKRFELLYRQFQDLMSHCAVFVPRDEVEAALHTVLSEVRRVYSPVVPFNGIYLCDQVKVIKTSYVDASLLREKLRKKADSADLDK